MKPAPEDDLEVLRPDREVSLDSGETVTVREFRFLEAQRLGLRAQPLIATFAELFAEPETEVDIEALAAAFSQHEEIFITLLAAATGRPEPWVRTLGDADGQLLMLTFWEVNKDFFVRRLMLRMAGHQPGPSVSATSSPH